MAFKNLKFSGKPTFSPSFSDLFRKFLIVFFLFRGVASRLDNTWKGFASGLDERTTVLALSVLFHQKAENVRGYLTN